MRIHKWRVSVTFDDVEAPNQETAAAIAMERIELADQLDFFVTEQAKGAETGGVRVGKRYPPTTESAAAFSQIFAGEAGE